MLTIATFNLCNLGVDEPAERFARLAVVIARELAGPDILALQEVKALAPVAKNRVPADAVYARLSQAIRAEGGPSYGFREVPPRPDQEGGHPHFNIRTGFLFNPERVQFVDRGPSSAEDSTAVRLSHGRAALTLSPGRIASQHPAFKGDSGCHWLPSRRVLAGEFRVQTRSIVLIACHLKSMRGATRRTQAYAKNQRHAQAQVIADFVRGFLVCDNQAAIVVLGDMNDGCGSQTLKLLKSDRLLNIVEQLPKSKRYTHWHEGQPHTLDHILLSHSLQPRASVCVPQIINSSSSSEKQASDHNPVLVNLDFP